MSDSALEQYATAAESSLYALRLSVDLAESHTTTSYHGDPDGRDSSSQVGPPMQFTLHVRIRASALHYFGSLPAAPNELVPRRIPASAEPLSKALRTAGIDIHKLDPSAENAMRLVLVASLVETLVPSPPANTGKAAAARLSNRRLMRVLAYVDAHIGEPIKLANLAAAAGLSRMYFARQFRAATGIRPHEHVLRRRVGRAQELLTTTSDPVVDIALSVGFQTQAHFTTVFKKIVGNTPRQWRKGQPL